MNKMIISTLLIFTLLITGGSYAFGQEIPEMKEGMKLFYENDLEGARKEFRAALEKQPENSLPLLYLLDCYARDKNLQPILNDLEEAALDAPESALAKAHLGLGYFAQALLGKDIFDESLAQFKEALKLDKNLAMGYLGLGIIYYKKRMIPRSRSYFSKAIKLNPNDVGALERLGEIFLLDDKNPQNAQNLFSHIIELYPTYPDGYFYYASACKDLKEYEKAIEFYQKTMELDPEGMTQGYYAPQRIGDIYFGMKNYEKAGEFFEKSLLINPENSYSKRMLELTKNPPKVEPEDDGDKDKDKDKDEKNDDVNEE